MYKKMRTVGVALFISCIALIGPRRILAETVDRSDQTQRLRSLFDRYFSSLSPRDELGVLESEKLITESREDGLIFGGYRERRAGEPTLGVYPYYDIKQGVSSL